MAQPASFVVAIDGPAASGKGTLAKRLAAHLGLRHLDTGLLYRGVGMAAVRASVATDDAPALAKLAAALDMAALPSDPDLRSEAAGGAASKVSVHPPVRAALLEAQRSFAAAAPGAVLDGRDVGTVVCPDAPAKLFVIASSRVRAQRRHSELLARAAAGAGAAAGGVPSFEAVLKDVEERDARDASRASAPMKPAYDALLLDTSDLDADAAFQAALAHVQARAAAVGWAPAAQAAAGAR